MLFMNTLHIFQHKLKTFLLSLKKELFSTTTLAIAGGVAICFGTYASQRCEFPILAPLLFAIGILLVVVFDLGLITRFVPTHTFTSANIAKLVLILVANLLTAYILGLFTSLSITPPDHLFVWSIIGGIVMGLVSLNHLLTTQYRVVIALLLMYIFVSLKLPHCVVYAFLGADFPTLITVVAGNLLGGMALNLGFRLICKSVK